MARRWDDATGVVTPEAVPLQFQEANVGSRLIGFVIDWTIIFTVAFFIFGAASTVVAAAGGEPPTWVVVVLVVIANLGLFFAYPVTLETLLQGRTVGKLALGLRVVTVEGAPIGFRHAVIRAALGIVDFFATLGVAATLSTMFSRRHQRLGDRAAGTVVVRERTASLHPEALFFGVPRGAEAYALTVDPSGVSTIDYEAGREFLLRAPTLAPEARYRMGERLATVLAAKSNHRPPPDVSPELFLVCLLARYQSRQWPAPQAPPVP